MNRVIHFEIHADDPARAAKFYTDVFGWEIKKWEGESMPMDYWMVMTGPEKESGIDGGLMKRMEPLAGTGVRSYVCTIGVSSVDEFLKKIEKAGGIITMPKMIMPGVGWMAQAKDTEGNIFGITQEDMSAK
jgi:uncharacterized protein